LPKTPGHAAFALSYKEIGELLPKIKVSWGLAWHIKMKAGFYPRHEERSRQLFARTKDFEVLKNGDY